MRLSEVVATVAVMALLCGAGLASGQTVTSAPAGKLTCGDQRIDVGLARLDLSPEQTRKLKPLFDKCLTESSEFRGKARPIRDKMLALREEAQKAGTLAALDASGEYQTLARDLDRVQQDRAKAADARYDGVLDELIKVLTPSQKRKFMTGAGLVSTDPKLIALSAAGLAIERWAVGIEFPDEALDRMTPKLAEMIQTYQADVAKAHETDPVKLRDWSGEHDRKMHEYIDSFMTPEQIRQAAVNRHDRFVKKTAAATGAVARSIDRLDPTPAQKEKVAALVTAAREKMDKLDSEDRKAWAEAYTQLNEDVDKLLTDEQRTKRDTPAGIAPPKPKS